MKNFYTFIFILFSVTLSAQNHYYYNGNEKVEIFPSENAFIAFEKPTEKTVNGFKKVKFFQQKGFTILENKKMEFSIKNAINLKERQMAPAYKITDGGEFKLFPTKIIRVKLNTKNSKSDLLKVLNEDKILRIEERYEIFRIHIKDIHEILNISNKIYESGIADFSIPDFYTPLELNQINDPLYPLQFQMNNTGQVIDGVNGVNDIDCNAPDAWDITFGNDITVAVFDQGLENHEDLGSRLVGGFTPANNGNGSPETNNATHGMNCAGVIGATDNNIGLRGVAPNVNLLSVNIFSAGTTHGDIADGIQWAINNGADILSNSWGISGAPCNYTSIDIENALQNAVTNGRNGNGSVVVFASGNTGGCVNYPARNENVIAVGAVDNRGNLFNYSSRGPELDLVAPSGQTNYLGNVRTLDRMGNNGRVAGNYENNFGGTSAACPVVSGVAALVLSLNPNLTQLEVRDILNNTATDMGVNGFDNNFGSGRVNAQAAIQETLNTLSITGPDAICGGSAYEGVLIIPQSLNNISNINWIVPNYPTYIRFGQGTEELHFSFFSSGSAVIKVDITLGSGAVLQFEKYVYSLSSTNNNNPVIDVAPNNPGDLVCCNTTGYYNVDHAVLTSGYTNTYDLEWQWNIQYQNPSDIYSFNDYDGTAYISVQKHTYSPLIVSVKMRTINDCSAASTWSNEISRYYGTVSNTSSKLSASNANSFDSNQSKIDYSNKSLPVEEFYIQNEKTLYVNYLNKYDWLQINYSNANLTDKDVKKIISILNGSEELNLEMFDLSGNSVYCKTLNPGSHQLNLSHFNPGIYIANYSLGEIKYPCKYIIK